MSNRSIIDGQKVDVSVLQLPLGDATISNQNAGEAGLLAYDTVNNVLKVSNGTDFVAMQGQIGILAPPSSTGTAAGMQLLNNNTLQLSLATQNDPGILNWTGTQPLSVNPQFYNGIGILADPITNFAYYYEYNQPYSVAGTTGYSALTIDEQSPIGSLPTMTISDGSGTSSCTMSSYNYEKWARMVHLNLGTFSTTMATASALYSTGTQLPTYLRPIGGSTRSFGIIMTVNGTNQVGRIDVSSTGQLAFYADVNGSVFASGATVSLYNGQTFTWSL